MSNTHEANPHGQASGVCMPAASRLRQKDPCHMLWHQSTSAFEEELVFAPSLPSSVFACSLTIYRRPVRRSLLPCLSDVPIASSRLVLAARTGDAPGQAPEKPRPVGERGKSARLSILFTQEYVYRYHSSAVLVPCPYVLVLPCALFRTCAFLPSRCFFLL